MNRAVGLLAAVLCCVLPPGQVLGGTLPARPATLERRVAGARSAVVVLHGLYLSPTSIERITGLTTLGQRAGFDVVYPGGIGLSWNAGWCCGRARAEGVDDLAFLRGTVAALRQRGIRRVVLAGFSNGGMMAYRYACALGDGARVDAVLVAAGTYESDRLCRYAGPIVHLHGLADTTVPFHGMAWSAFLAAPLRDVRTIRGLAPLARLSVRPLAGVGHTWPAAPAAAVLVTEFDLGR